MGIIHTSSSEEEEEAVLKKKVDVEQDLYDPLLLHAHDHHHHHHHQSNSTNVSHETGTQQHHPGTSFLRTFFNGLNALSGLSLSLSHGQQISAIILYLLIN